jgi:DNA-binding FrmR family transcriptional regulator
MESGVEEPYKISGDNNARLVNRLARIEGQIRGLRRMIEEDKQCEDILTQLAAVRSALDSVGVNLISYHMRECLQGEIDSEIDPAAMEKAFEIFLKYVRCMK